MDFFPIPSHAWKDLPFITECVGLHRNTCLKSKFRREVERQWMYWSPFLSFVKISFKTHTNWKKENCVKINFLSYQIITFEDRVTEYFAKEFLLYQKEINRYVIPLFSAKNRKRIYYIFSYYRTMPIGVQGFIGCICFFHSLLIFLYLFFHIHNAENKLFFVRALTYTNVKNLRFTFKFSRKPIFCLDLTIRTSESETYDRKFESLEE